MVLVIFTLNCFYLSFEVAKKVGIDDKKLTLIMANSG